MALNTVQSSQSNKTWKNRFIFPRCRICSYFLMSILSGHLKTQRALTDMQTPQNISFKKIMTQTRWEFRFSIRVSLEIKFLKKRKWLKRWQREPPKKRCKQMVVKHHPHAARRSRGDTSKHEVALPSLGHGPQGSLFNPKKAGGFHL